MSGRSLRRRLDLARTLSSGSGRSRGLSGRSPCPSNMVCPFQALFSAIAFLVLNFDADDEAPLPHVYFEAPDYRLSPLCLFDPMANEWNPSMSIAKTTVPWAVRWLACYELWEATGWWHGGGRHMAQEDPKDVT
jgi:hypothetical protein